MYIGNEKDVARQIFEEILKPSFQEIMRYGKMLQVTFMYDMSAQVLCTDYPLKIKIEKALEPYVNRSITISKELNKLFYGDPELDDVILFYNPGEDTGDLMVNREEYYTFLYLNN